MWQSGWLCDLITTTLGQYRRDFSGELWPNARTGCLSIWRASSQPAPPVSSLSYSISDPSCRYTVRRLEFVCATHLTCFRSSELKAILLCHLFRIINSQSSILMCRNVLHVCSIVNNLTRSNKQIDFYHLETLIATPWIWNSSSPIEVCLVLLFCCELGK